MTSVEGALEINVVASIASPPHERIKTIASSARFMEALKDVSMSSVYIDGRERAQAYLIVHSELAQALNPP